MNEDQLPLNPCRLCGGKAKLKYEWSQKRQRDLYFAICPKCVIRTDWALDKYEAQEQWDRAMKPI